MPLPPGFKVNGTKVDVKQMRLPPRVRKIMALLDKMPAAELLTTMDLGVQIGLSVSGGFMNHPSLAPYREKVDGKLFWGSPKSITQLRKQLAESEEPNDQN